MKFNRRAIVEGYYWYCADFHQGQGSELYKRLCKISTYFRPAMRDCGPSTEKSLQVYLDLQKKSAL